MSTQDPAPGQEPAPALSLSAERRAYVRLSSDLEASCQPPGRVLEAGWLGKVHDISLGGIGLLLRHCFRPGTALAVELRDDTGKLLRTVRLHVVHATAVLADGHQCWLIGCTFGEPLSAG